MMSSLPPWVKQVVLPLALMLLVAFGVFGNTLGHDWTYDDFPVIVENPDVKSWSGFIDNSLPSRPLRELTYLVDHALFGMEPAGYHVQSILWHGLAGFLLYSLMVSLGFGRWAGLCAGMLFLVHPVTVEAVANVSHRKESLALVFSLLSLVLYHRAFVTSRTCWLNLTGSFCLAGVAFLGKQTAVCLPIVFFAYEWVFVERTRWFLLRWWRVWAGLVIAGISSGFFWLWKVDGLNRYVESMHGLLQSKGNFFEHVSFATYAQTVLKSWAFTFSKLILPLDLAAEYIISPPAGWIDPWVLSCLFLLVGMIIVLVFLARKHSPSFFFLVFGLAFFLPVSNVWPLAYLAADRYLYVPWAALAMFVSWLIFTCTKRPLLSALLVIFLAMPMATLSWQQNQVWASPETLWTHALKVNPESSFVLNNVGNLHLLRNDMVGAMSYYSAALKVNPLNPTAWYNLGYIAEKRRELPSAIRYYQQFINVADGPWQKDVSRVKAHLMMTYRLQLERGPFDPSIVPP